MHAPTPSFPCHCFAFTSTPRPPSLTPPSTPPPVVRSHPLLPFGNMDDLNPAMHCAMCGDGGEGGAGLKMCNLCKYIKYCSVACQRGHWPRHKKDCKQRTARLCDESLFKQPPPKEDCLICFLPMPFSNNHMATFYPCCGKKVCRVCDYSNNHAFGNTKCLFCNTTIQNNETAIDHMKKRTEANDVNALNEIGGRCTN
jgi:hypothetical protein